jgi:hypothetical protein
MLATLRNATLVIAALGLAACAAQSTDSAAINVPGAANVPAPGTTLVGEKARQLRGDLDGLVGRLSERQSALQAIRQGNLEQSQRYFATLAAMNARLQTGSTPGNPVLVAQWNEAQGALDRMNEDVGRLNKLSTIVASDAAYAAYLGDATRAAFSLSGAMEEDHKALARLQDDVNRSQVLVERLLTDVSDDLARQTGYIAAERRNLTALSVAIKTGEAFGGASLASRAANFGISGAGQPSAAASPPMPVTAERRALVTIRFDRANPQYEQALYNAVSQALERRPDASFDLVAVAPGRTVAGGSAVAGSQVRRQAEQVLRSLTDMGLPASRVNLSATTSSAIEANEVQLFVR